MVEPKFPPPLPPSQAFRVRRFFWVLVAPSQRPEQPTETSQETLAHHEFTTFTTFPTGGRHTLPHADPAIPDTPTNTNTHRANDDGHSDHHPTANGSGLHPNIDAANHSGGRGAGHAFESSPS